MSQEPSQAAIDRARTEAYRQGLTPEQGEILLRTGKTPAQLQAEQAQRLAEIREDIQSFKQEQIGAKLRGGELARQEVRRTYDGGIVQKQTLLGERRPAVDTRSDIEIFKEAQAQLRAEGKTFVGRPVQIRRDAATGQVREIRGRVAPRFAVGDVYLSYSSPLIRPSSRTQAQFTQSDDSVFVTPDPLNPFNIVAIPTSEAKKTPAGFEVEFDPTDPAFGLNQVVGYGAAVTKAQETNPFAPKKDDPIAGVRGVVENILDSLTTSAAVYSKVPQALFGGKDSAQAWYDIEYELARYDERFKPELEGGLISTGISAAKEKITTGETTESAKQFENLTKAIIENPAYFAGSGAASAALWFGPGAGAKVRSLVNVARSDLRVGRGLRAVETVMPDLIERPGAVEITREGKKFVEAFTPGITSVQKMGKTATFEIGTELTDPSVARYVAGRVNPKTGDVDLITRQLLTKSEEFVVPPSRRSFIFDLESFGLKQVKEGEPRQLGMARGSDIYDPQKIVTEVAKEVPTAMPSMPIFRRSQTIRELQRFTDPFREQRGKLVATIETFKPEELEAYARSISRPAPATDPTDITRAFVPRTPKARTPTRRTETQQPQLTEQVKLSDIEKTISRWAQDTAQAERASEKAVSDAVKVITGDTVGFTALGSTQRAFAEESSLGLGGGANVFTSREPIGFKGATGAGRKRRGRQEDDVMFTLGLNQIPGMPQRQLNRGLITTDMRDALDVGPRFRGGTTTRDASIVNQTLAQYNKMVRDLQPRTSDLTSLKTDTVLSVESLTGQRSATMEAQALRQSLNQAMGFESMQGRIQSSRTIPRIRTPRIRQPPIIGLPSTSKRKERRRKKGSRRAEVKRPVRDILEVAYGEDFAKAFNKRFGLKDIYDT